MGTFELNRIANLLEAQQTTLERIEQQNATIIRILTGGAMTSSDAEILALHAGTTASLNPNFPVPQTDIDAPANHEREQGVTNEPGTQEPDTNQSETTDGRSETGSETTSETTGNTQSVGVTRIGASE